MPKNNPPPSDPTPMELAHNVGDNPNAPYTTTKIQPCDLEPTFESMELVVINIIDSNVATPLWPSVGVKPNIWKSWRFGVLRDSRMFRAQQKGPKHLALRCSWCHWKGLKT